MTCIVFFVHVFISYFDQLYINAHFVIFLVPARNIFPIKVFLPFKSDYVCSA